MVVVNKIFETKFGSTLYGTSTPESDLDLKGIYLPSAKEIVLGNYKKTINICRKKKEGERNTKDDIDIEIFSLDRFLELLTEGQTTGLDLLFASPDMFTHITDEGRHIMFEIDVNRDKLLTKNVNAFVSYARRQASVYGIKGSRFDALKRTMSLLESLPERDRLSQHSDKIEQLIKESEELVSLEKTPLIEIVHLPTPDKKSTIPHLHANGRKISYTSTIKLAKETYGKALEGYGQRAVKASLNGSKDFKALSHAVRVNNEALELLTTGKITFPRPDRELLVKIKTLQMPYEEIATLIEEGLVKLTEAHEKSTLREKPDQEWVDNFIYKVYSDIVKRG